MAVEMEMEKGMVEMEKDRHGGDEFRIWWRW